MTDRGLSTVDAAPACPFVAFEDDRDGRALAPDHRHRCFAEPRPAPRAAAHQETYCLSSAFPVCPTFQDWARREAAAARPSRAQDRAPADEPPTSRPMPPLEPDDRRAHRTDTPPPLAPRRNAQRDWAAPPPWQGDEPAPPPEARGLAGSAADRLAGGDALGTIGAAGAGVAGVAGGTALSGQGSGAVPRYDDASYQDDDLDADDRRSARPESGSRVPEPQRFEAPEPRDDEPDWAQDDAGAGNDRDDRQYAAPVPSRRQAARDERRQPPPNPHDQVRRREPLDPQELFGPAWERPRRYEAYPSLRTRVGLPDLGGIGRIGMAALALAFAALLVFFIGPMLLGIGSKSDAPGAGAGATATPIVEATATPDPTPVPEPTPQVYLVAKGDTMSKIAKKFGLTIEQLMTANPQVKNPDKISIGDPLTIPVPVSDNGTIDGGSPSP